MEAYRRLNRRQQKFVDALVMYGTGSEAVRRAGLKRRDGRPIQRPKQLAWRLRKNPLIEEAFKEMKALATGAWLDRVDRYLLELERIGTFDRNMLKGPDGKVLPEDQWPEEARAAIASVDNGVIKTWNKNEALRALLQFIANPPQRHEHSGKDGAPIPIAAVVAEASDTDAMALYMQMVAPRSTKGK